MAWAFLGEGLLARETRVTGLPKTQRAFGAGLASQDGQSVV